MEPAKPPPEKANFAPPENPGFNHNEILSTRVIPSGQKTQENNTGAEEIVMIGVRLPVTALAKAMALSGLMWVAIVYQVVVWVS